MESQQLDSNTSKVKNSLENNIESIKEHLNENMNKLNDKLNDSMKNNIMNKLKSKDQEKNPQELLAQVSNTQLDIIQLINTLKNDLTKISDANNHASDLIIHKLDKSNNNTIYEDENQYSDPKKQILEITNLKKALIESYPFPNSMIYGNFNKIEHQNTNRIHNILNNSEQFNSSNKYSN